DCLLKGGAGQQEGYRAQQRPRRTDGYPCPYGSREAGWPPIHHQRHHRRDLQLELSLLAPQCPRQREPS
ncbi:unnamed protein product, partial [Chrysoparadoxa australica]